MTLNKPRQAAEWETSGSSTIRKIKKGRKRVGGNKVKVFRTKKSEEGYLSESAGGRMATLVKFKVEQPSTTEKGKREGGREIYN